MLSPYVDKMSNQYTRLCRGKMHLRNTPDDFTLAALAQPRPEHPDRSRRMVFPRLSPQRARQKIEAVLAPEEFVAELEGGDAEDAVGERGLGVGLVDVGDRLGFG